MSVQIRQLCSFVRSQWFTGWVMLFCVLVPAWCPAETSRNIPIPPSDDQSLQLGYAYTQAQLLDETLGVEHDELIMLVISLVVAIQIAVSFKFVKRFPFKSLLLCSFGAVALSAFFTVAESFVFTEVFNYLEHLSFMAASILSAVWCWCVFVSKKQEGS